MTRIHTVHDNGTRMTVSCAMPTTIARLVIAARRRSDTTPKVRFLDNTNSHRMNVEMTPWHVSQAAHAAYKGRLSELDGYGPNPGTRIGVHIEHYRFTQLDSVHRLTDGNAQGTVGS